MHSADSIWLNRADVHGRRKLFEEERKEVLPGVTAIRVGGHFQGSLVVHWDQAGAGAVTEDGEEDGEEKKGWLGIADSFVTVPVRFILPEISLSLTLLPNLPFSLLSPLLMGEYSRASHPIRDHRAKQVIVSCGRSQI